MSADPPSNPLNILGFWSLSSPRHCLDLRPAEQYAKAHLTPSTSIPLSTLEQRFSQLPPRTSNTSFLLITEPNAQFNGRPVADHLGVRGWKVDGVIEVSSDGDAFWNSARGLNVFGTGAEGAELLFQPSPILGAWVTWIEESMKRHGRVEGRVLDIGCGSGRDLGFLATRQFKWKVTGMDNWKKALERAEVIVRSIDAERLEELVHAEIDESSGMIVSLSGLSELEMEATLEGMFDLVLIVRFFPKELFRYIHRFLRQGGYLLFSHFTNPEHGKDYDSPPPEKRVQPTDVERILMEGSQDWRILQAEYSESEDGRKLWDVVARYGEID